MKRAWHPASPRLSCADGVDGGDCDGGLGGWHEAPAPPARFVVEGLAGAAGAVDAGEPASSSSSASICSSFSLCDADSSSGPETDEDALESRCCERRWARGLALHFSTGSLDDDERNDDFGGCKSRSSGVLAPKGDGDAMSNGGLIGGGNDDAGALCSTPKGQDYCIPPPSQ
eukprot:SM004861S16937  [mRNA]  locus=s4861:77:731:- [translate_table: standard]